MVISRPGHVPGGKKISKIFLHLWWVLNNIYALKKMTVQTFFSYSARIFHAASERTLTEKTQMFILWAKLLSLIHLCHLRLYTICFEILIVSLIAKCSHFFMYTPRFQKKCFVMEMWFYSLEFVNGYFQAWMEKSWGKKSPKSWKSVIFIFVHLCWV